SGYHVAWAGMRGDTFAPGVQDLSCDRSGFTVAPEMLFQKSPFDRNHRFARAHYSGLRPAPGPALDHDEAATRTAEEWLADGIPEPWVLFVPLIFPHPPFEVEEPWFSLHDRADMPAPRPKPARAPRFVAELNRRHQL